MPGLLQGQSALVALGIVGFHAKQLEAVPIDPGRSEPRVVANDVGWQGFELDHDRWTAKGLSLTRELELETAALCHLEDEDRRVRSKEVRGKIRATRLRQIANARLRGRHLLRQNPEEHSKQYLLERVQQGGRTPFLMNTSAKDRYGVLIELTAGYPSTYGTVLQTDVTCELCRALFEAYPPGK